MMARRVALSAKLTPPRSPGAVPRSKLFAQLDRLRREADAIWIEGEPGAGKTTLIATWLERRRAPRLWLRVDAGDAEPATFFHYLGLAARAAGRGRRRPLPALTPEYHADPVPFVRAFFRELYAGLRPGTVVVFDDVHELPPDSAVHSILRVATEECPRGVCLVLSSRGELPPSLARLHASRALRVLPRRELRLAPAEARAISRSWRVSGRDAEDLRRTADGWTAGLVLLLARTEAHLGSLTGPRRVEAATFDYFAGEILDRADPLTRRVLLETSLLPHATGELAAAATGLPEARGVLAAIARKGLFTVRHESAEDAYEFHPLFRSFLRRRAGEELSPAREGEVRRAAAAFLASRGERAAELAVGLLAEAGAFAEMAPLVVREAPGLLAAGRFDMLERWLSLLPAPIREGDPWLLLVGARARLARDPGEARESFRRAFELAEDQQDERCAWLAWAGTVEAIALELKDLSALGPLADAHHQLLARFGPPREPEAAFATTFAALTILVFHRPEDPIFRAAAEEARQAALAPGDPRLRLVTGAHYCVFHGFFRGDLGRVRPLLEVLGPLARSPGADPLTAIMWFTAEGVTRAVSGDGAAAVAAADEALRLSAERGVHVWDRVALEIAVLAGLAADDVQRARRHVDLLRLALSTGSEVDVGIGAAVLAVVALREGAIETALRQGEAGRKIVERGGFAPTVLLAHVALARARLLVGDGSAAAEHLAQVREGAARVGSPFFAHLAALAEAELFLRRGDPSAALGPLRESLALSREYGLRPHLLYAPAEVAPLYGLALASGVERDHVLRLVRERAMPAPRDAGPEWPWPVRIRALGRFKIELEGGRTFSPGRTQRPLALLRALVAFGGRAVPDGDLADALWPDAEADDAHHTLEVTLSRLRSLLGHEVVQLRARTLSLSNAACWVDTLELDATLRTQLAALEHGRSIDPAALRAGAARVTALYRGPLLDGDGEPWAIAARDRLRARLRRWLDALAALSGDPAGAEGVRATLASADVALFGPADRPLRLFRSGTKTA
jgi:ATP/maltotriose-dependent transcriptional regulator MalT